MSDTQDLLAQAKASLVNPKPREGWITLEREYELITPLFGGGPTPGEVDPVTPIRGTEIRGQLRFWWRATRGGQFNGSLKEMKKAEDEIWGSAGKHNEKEKDKNIHPPVQIAVMDIRYGKTDWDEPFIHEGGKSKPNPNSNVPAYAAFPLQRTEKELKQKTPPPPRKVLWHISFVLRISFHEDHKKDVEAALWAWETFGGVGARTRRGFGAVHYVADRTGGERKPVAPPTCDAEAIKKQIKKKLKDVAPSDGQWPKGVPHLASNMVLEIVDVNGDAAEAWKELIKQLRKFRQSREGDEYGPSHWPEGNVVRRAAGRSPSDKSPDLGDIAPRAQLGLPVIFHLPQDKTPDGTLKAKNTERVASRLILRPLRCTGGQAVALAAVLKAPIIPPDDILVIEVDGDEVKVAHKPSSSQAKQIVPLDGETSLIKAFFKQLRGEK